MNIMWISFILQVLFACTTKVLGGTHPDGVSKTTREQDALGNYKFSYAVSNPEGEHFREEGTDPLGRVIGSYGLTHIDGTQRVVEYVADKDGFRAAIRSNEPGVISSESADASLLKLQPDLSLAVAATSIENSGAAFGSRLKTDTSRVSYEDKLPQKAQTDNSAKESRLRSYEDYRPRNPVAYYPSGTLDTARPLRTPEIVASDIPARPHQQRPSDETRPLDVYLPPIDPQTAVRRPPYLSPRERTSNRSPYTTTSQRPYIPPYGGFDDDDDPVPVPVERRPGISMTTIHGGLGRDDFESPQISTPGYGAGRYPSDDGSYISREYINPYFPPRSNFPPVPRHPGGVLSSPPRSGPGGPIFAPPSYDTRQRTNFVLRAVPIPNGIQAVRVDPETGHVYERLVYPLFLRDGQTVYDKNILLHNDDVSDDSVARNRNPGYFDIAFRRRPPFRAIRNPSFDLDEEFGNVTRFNRSIDPLTMSIPTSNELEWIDRQLSQVEGFDRSRFPPNPSVFRNPDFRDSEYPMFNDFDDAPDENSRSEDLPPARTRGSARDSFSRDPRLIDRLTPEDTKEIVSKSGSLTAEVKPAETDSKPSVVAKDR